jgi:hypothetical protein
MGPARIPIYRQYHEPDYSCELYNSAVGDIYFTFVQPVTWFTIYSTNVFMFRKNQTQSITTDGIQEEVLSRQVNYVSSERSGNVLTASFVEFPLPKDY